VENTLSFSRKEQGETEETDLKDLIDKTIELAGNDYDLKKGFDFRNIEINREYDSAHNPVMCQPGKIQQVILNLLKNGAQAMAENQTSRKPSFSIRLQPDGDMTRIEVEDNGTGMTDEVCRQIFEPFFTTKEKGDGTGLGLSVSYFIIAKDHAGHMSVESTPGMGTKFIIRLP